MSDERVDVRLSLPQRHRARGQNRARTGARLMDRRMKPCAKCGHGKSLHLTHGCRKTWTKRGQTFAGIGTYTEWCRCDGYQEKEQA